MSLFRQPAGMAKNKINIENPAEPAEFNEVFNRELDDNFIFKD